MMGLSSQHWTVVLVAMMTITLSASTPGQTQGLMPNSRPPSAFPVSSDITRQSDVIPLSSGMLGSYMPRISNLELGYQYFFGNKVRSGQVSADYLLPYNLGNDAVLFGEAHGNYWNIAQKPAGVASNRVDLSIGGGARKIYSNELFLGIHGFYDTSRLFNKWYSSGSVGLEMAAIIGTNDAVDLNANWYSDLFSSNSILSLFTNRGGSYDIEAGYSHALFNQCMDLRLKLALYKVDTRDSVYGYMTGADLTTRDGMFTLRYEYANDKVNGSLNNIGAFVNVGFQVENIVKGESPVTMPEPVFRAPRNRNLQKMLTQKVKRDWDQRHAPGGVTCSVYRTTPDGALGEFESNYGRDFIEGPEPYTCMTSGLCAKVTFHWEMVDVGFVGFGVFIQGDNCTRNITHISDSGKQSGDFTLWGPQNDFIDNGCSPTGLLIVKGSPQAVTLSGVTITFNSECHRNW